jgi:hypothetical protein
MSSVPPPADRAGRRAIREAALVLGGIEDGAGHRRRAALLGGDIFGDVENVRDLVNHDALRCLRSVERKPAGYTRRRPV